MNVEQCDDGKWKVSATVEELRSFAASIGLPQRVAERCSRRLLALLAAGVPARRGFVDPVVDEILVLEGLRPTTGTGEAREFAGMHLKGLQHKHWFEAGFIPKNLSNLWTKKARENPDENLLEGVPDRLEGESDEARVGRLSRHLAHVTTIAAFEEKAAARELTGEWIVFKCHSAKNYYLTLGTHPKPGRRDEQDRQLAQEIAQICSDDFPFLLGTFGTSAASDAPAGETA